MALMGKIIVNNEFYFEPYEYGFKVTQIKKGKTKVKKNSKDKKSEEIKVESYSYYPKLSQVCNHILNNSVKKAKVLEDIPKIIEKTEKDFSKQLKK